MKLAMPPDYLADEARRRTEHDAALNANRISVGQLLFLPLVLIAAAISAVLPFVGAVLSILGTWVLIVFAILFVVVLWRL
jgi:hypothetical protein